MTRPGHAEERWPSIRTGGGLKIHPPTLWRADIKVCEAVRARRRRLSIMLDSTWATISGALRSPVLEEMGFHWYEYPLADQDDLTTSSSSRKAPVQ